MSKLACNIVSYRPDPAFLAANFSPWHAEALLCEAATLLDRCLADFKEYSSLDRGWRSYQNDLEILEKEVELDLRRAAEETPVEESPVEEKAPAPEPEPVQQEASGEEAEGERGEAEGEPPPAEALEEEGVPDTFLGLRTEAVRRKKELAAPGGPFALDEQRDLVLRRLCRDYEEAVNRVSVAEEGIRLIYGYDGDPNPLSSWADTLADSVTSLAIWTRNALEWLARYQRKEQSFTRAFSVRALMNRNAWGQLRHARDSFSVRLQVPMELFQGYGNCRLLGMSASLLGEAGSVPWSALVRLPEAAWFVRGGKKIEVDQSALPPLLLGRVENRRSVRRSEFCGMVSHQSASPIGRPSNEGQWYLELLRPVGSSSEQFAQVDDMVVEIKAAGLPAASEREQQGEYQRS